MMRHVTGYGDDGGIVSVVTSDEDAQKQAALVAATASAEKAAFWRDVKLSVVSAVLSGIALYFVMKYVERSR